MIEDSYLRIERRILGYNNQVVDGVEPEPDSVERLVRGCFEWKKHLWLVKLK